MEKNRKMKMMGKPFTACTSPVWRSHDSPDSCGSVSLSTPKKGTVMYAASSLDKDLDRGGKQWATDLVPEDTNNSWLTEKIRECGEMVGISIDKHKGGWDNLIVVCAQ